MTNRSGSAHKLARARTQLLLGQPFFGSLCLRLAVVPGPVPTMATNGRQILYNPQFVESLTPAELEAVLAHEVMHVALAHHCRRGDRELKTWNEATDFAINPILIAGRARRPGLGAGSLRKRASQASPAPHAPVEIMQMISVSLAMRSIADAGSHFPTHQELFETANRNQSVLEYRTHLPLQFRPTPGKA